jgi:hypothetical protein
VSINGSEKFRLPLSLEDRFQITERALFQGLPEALDVLTRKRLIDAIASSLSGYHDLHLPLQLVTGTELQIQSGLDILFSQTTPDGQHITPVRMRDMLTPTLGKKGQMVVKVLDHAHVIGMTWPQPGESFLDCYKRAETLRQGVLWYADPALMGRRRHFDLEPMIAVLTDQQLNMWTHRPGDVILPPESYRKEGPPLDRVLQCVRDALTAAGLGDTHFPRVTTLSNHEVEIMIVDAEGKLAPVETLGIRHLNSGSSVTTEWVDQTVGIKCFEPNVSETFRIETVRSLSHHFRTVEESSGGTVPQHRILSMTPKLLEIWEQQYLGGKVPIRTSEKTTSTASELVPEMKLEIVNSPEGHSQVKGIRYMTFERSKPGIGAKPSWIAVDFADGSSEHLCLDFGSQREDYYYNSLFDPSIRLGMAPFHDILPSTAEVPKFYRLTLLLKSAEISGASFLTDIPHNSDLIDLYLTLTKSDFRRLIHALDPLMENSEQEQILEQLERIVQDDTQKKNMKHIGFLISHFHDDHIGFAALVGSHIPQVMSIESAPWRELFFNRGGWMDEVSIRRQRQTLLSEKEQRYYAPQQHLLQPFETRFLGRGKISVTCLPCDHSIYGASMFLMVVYDDHGEPLYRTLYTGDYRFNDNNLTELSVDFLEAIGGVDTIITETTNVRPEKANSKKSSTLLTKERLHEEYDALLREAQNQPILVQVDPKDLELIQIISQLAIDQGREVIYGIRHSEPIELFRQYDAANALNEVSSEHQQRTTQLLAPQLPGEHWLNQVPVRTQLHHPRPQFSSSTKILEPQKETLSKSERRIIQYHPDQMLPWQQLPFQRNPLIFVRPTNPLEEEMANVAQYLGNAGSSQRVTVVRAHYFTYQERDRDLAWRDRKFCQRMKWRYLSDLEFDGQAIHPSGNPRFRMSGHSKSEDFFSFMERLLAVNPQMRIIPVHGQARRYVGHEMERRYGQNVDIVKQMDKGKFELRLY